MNDPASPPTGTNYKSLHSAATFLQLLYGLFIVAALVVLATGWAYRDALLGVVGSTTSLGTALQREDSFVAASGLLGGVNIVLVVSFVVWFWRAYSNLSALGRPRRRKAGWAIASWVIPIANFFIPYQIGSEIWRMSLPDRSGTASLKDVNVEPVISWWALFVLMGLVNQIAFFSGRDVGDNVEKMAAVVGVDLIGGVVSIAAAIAALRFVRGATRRQEEALRLHVGSIERPVP